MDEIVGYWYWGGAYKSDALWEVMSIPRDDPDRDIEDVLNEMALAYNIDRDDEDSYDSDEFPKVIYQDDVEDGFEWS